MNYYLLAFPRSGSSLTRSVISYITGMVPRQPQGHCELDHICKKFYIKNHTDKFFKFHFPKDENHYVECRENNKLILLLRNKYENILSYLFSFFYKFLV